MNKRTNEQMMNAIGWTIIYKYNFTIVEVHCG